MTEVAYGIRQDGIRDRFAVGDYAVEIKNKRAHPMPPCHAPVREQKFARLIRGAGIGVDSRNRSGRTLSVALCINSERLMGVR